MIRAMEGDRVRLVSRLFPRNGVVAEVGAHTGAFSSQIIAACRPRLFLAIDAWRFIPGEYERDPMNRRERNFRAAEQRCRQGVGTASQVAVVNALSEEAALMFADESMDAVYLDADHTEPGIRGDIERWWPKIRSQGVLAGHDYTERDWIDVIPVVDEFVEREGLELRLSTEAIPSWAVVKP